MSRPFKKIMKSYFRTYKFQPKQPTTIPGFVSRLQKSRKIKKKLTEESLQLNRTWVPVLSNTRTILYKREGAKPCPPVRGAANQERPAALKQDLRSRTVYKLMKTDLLKMLRTRCSKSTGRKTLFQRRPNIPKTSSSMCCQFFDSDGDHLERLFYYQRASGSHLNTSRQ